MADNPDFVVHVDLSEPDLTANVIRKLIPYLQMLIPSDMYDAGNRFVTLELSGNPNISPDLIEELRKRLPNCKFLKYTPVPTGTLNVIETGMSQEQVIRTIGTLMYDQRTAWPGDKMQTINMLGSQMNVKYKNSDGLATWTYFTDDIGVGVLGIDFDKDQNVAAVWSDRGIPRSRKLTPIAPPVVGGL